MKISYNWLKWYIPEAPDVDKLADIITYHLAEVESVEKKSDGDSILDIKILPNRAHDLLSHKGVAREIASLLNIQYVDPATKYIIPESKSTELTISINTDKCKRYMGRIAKGVNVGPSPDWMVKHLEAIGQRSINNIVDAANIVLFNCGQPTHVFDLDKMDNKIFIRDAKEDEEIITLDNKNIKLKSSHIVVTDNINILEIGGLKGGKTAEVDGDTKNIILEVSNFEAVPVRKMSVALGFRTEGSKRHENDLSPESAPYAMDEFSALIAEMCPNAVFEDIIDIYPQKQIEKKLSFRIEKVISILGVLVTVEQVKDILERYNLSYVEKEGVFEIIVPSMRLDLQIEEDMAEEIGRILGYDKVKEELPKIEFKPKQNETYNKILWARNKLIENGYGEVMNSSFRDKGEVSVLASASDKKFLRDNLSDGIQESVKLNRINAPLLGIKDVRIFEIGTVWCPQEEIRVVYANDKEGKVEKTLDDFCKDMPKDFSVEYSNSRLETKFEMWSLFPFIVRDVAVWVGEGVRSVDVVKIIKDNMGNMVVRGPELFDEFKKEDKTSYAFKLVFQSFERTLTDLEINEVMTKIKAKIEENGWVVR